jgi:hypothetical protein
MARTPRASVPKTSGSGVSRLSYQKGYSLGNRGTSTAGGEPPSVASASAEAVRTPRGRKAELKGGDGDLNIAFSRVQPVENLSDVQGFAKGAPPKNRYEKQAATKMPINSKELPSGWKK